MRVGGEFEEPDPQPVACTVVMVSAAGIVRLNGCREESAAQGSSTTAAIQAPHLAMQERHWLSPARCNKCIDVPMTGLLVS